MIYTNMFLLFRYDISNVIGLCHMHNSFYPKEPSTFKINYVGCHLWSHIYYHHVDVCVFFLAGTQKIHVICQCLIPLPKRKSFYLNITKVLFQLDYMFFKSQCYIVIYIKRSPHKINIFAI